VAFDRIIEVLTPGRAGPWPFTVAGASGTVTVTAKHAQAAGFRRAVLQLRVAGQPVAADASITGAAPAGTLLAIGDAVAILREDLTFQSASIGIGSFLRTNSRRGFRNTGLPGGNLLSLAGDYTTFYGTPTADAANFANLCALLAGYQSNHAGLVQAVELAPNGPQGIWYPLWPPPVSPQTDVNTPGEYTLSATMPAGEALAQFRGPLPALAAGQQLDTTPQAGAGQRLWASLLSDVLNEEIVTSADNASATVGVEVERSRTAQWALATPDVPLTLASRIVDESGAVWNVNGVTLDPNRRGHAIAEATRRLD